MLSSLSFKASNHGGKVPAMSISNHGGKVASISATNHGGKVATTSATNRKERRQQPYNKNQQEEHKKATHQEVKRNDQTDEERMIVDDPKSDQNILDIEKGKCSIVFILITGQLSLYTVNDPKNWITSSFLDLISFGYHSYLQLLICSVCEKCWSPSAALTHAHNHNDKLKIKTLQHEFNRVVQEYNIPDTPTLQYPDANRAPVNGLFVQKDGHACVAPGCFYACPLVSSMQTHWKTIHSELLFRFLPSSTRYRLAEVQSYYAKTANKFWTVDSTLSNRSSNDLYQTFRTQYLPSLELADDDHIDPPTLPRDVPLWLRVCDFHGYLGDNLLDKTKRNKLVEAATHPREGHPEYGKLHKWVFEYMASLRHISKHKVVYTVLKWILSMSPE
jgi:hypothetical protein